MKKIIILGAGTSGTMMANHLSKKLNNKDYEITIVDQEKKHYYQPGFLFIPFGIYKPDDVIQEKKHYLPKTVTYINKTIEKVDARENKVILEGKEELSYDILIIATGSQVFPEEVEGMKESLWYKDIFDFYTFEGAVALYNKLKDWEGGKMLVHISELPYKCPVAPLEFAFLADDFFRKKGIRDKVDITFVTPLDGAFTKPKATKALHYLLEKKGISEVTNFNIGYVDNENKKIVDYGGREVEFDLLVTIPPNLGSPVIERSGLGDDMNYVPTHKGTLQSLEYENIFVIGDATNLPASKAGSVAHFEAEILTENIIRFIEGKELKDEFDGHANCFIETGNNKALLIDFNYTTEPVEGKFPIPVIGPMSLLKESVLNHWGKMLFKWIYWNMLLKGRPIPFVTPTMSTKGKKLD